VSPRIVIAGGGVAGWLTAAILAKACGADAIRLIDEGGVDTSLGPFGSGVAARPGFPVLIDEMGWDEAALLRMACGGYALGTAFDGWSAPDRSWFLAHGESGAPIGSVAFHHLAARLRDAGGDVRHADYCLAALAAQADRFIHPSADPRSPLSTYSYGLHLDGQGLAQFLRETSGVEALTAAIAGIDRRDDGGIASLRLTDDRSIAGDLFVDCTGPAARLIGAMPGASFESWRAWLPCDRAIARLDTTADAPAPYAHHAAHDAGWVRQLPLNGNSALTLLYASGAMPDADAEASLGASPVSFSPGRQTLPWIANCVAIGAAAGVSDPLIGLDLQLAVSAAQRLLRLLPHPQTSGIEAREYNRITAAELDRARDAAILPWKTNGRRGQPLWDVARAMEVPDTLAHKIALFESRGSVPLYDEEPLDREDWVAMFDGQQVRPRRYDPLADAVPHGQLEGHLDRLRSVLTRAAAAMPRHADYLGRTA
jgi:tryptophan halogenase